MLSRFFKRRGSSKSRSRGRKKFPERKLAPVEEIAEQGLLVANVAARMSVKNSIIMNALKNNVDYNVSEIRALAREKLQELSSERGRDARHIKRVRDEIRKYGRSAWQESEYGNEDSRMLRHRQEVYELLSEELESEANDEEFVEKLASEARDQAWSEIGDSLKERATHPYYSGGDSVEYREARDERIQKLIEEDIADLLSPKKKPRKKKRS